MKRIWNTLKTAYVRYDRFMEKQGFGIVLAVCVLIIVSSAIYTFHFREKWAQDTIVIENTSKAVDAQEAQTLKEAQQASMEWIEQYGTADTPEASALRERIGELFLRAEGTMN